MGAYILYILVLNQNSISSGIRSIAFVVFGRIVQYAAARIMRHKSRRLLEDIIIIIFS